MFDNKNNIEIQVDGKIIGNGSATYIIAEMSANHGGDFNRAVDIVHAAKEAGADAVKLQTYTADTLTLKGSHPLLYIDKGPWKGQTLHQLYQKAYTPWEWQPRLKEIADKIGITLFSAPFDETAVDFLEEIDMPAHKIASYELIDEALLEKVAATGKPLFVSTGSATLSEIDKAVRILKQNKAMQIILLKCTSIYPAPPEDINLLTIPHLQKCFDLPVGFSDHSLSIGASVAAVALGACVIEKHLMLDESKNTSTKNIADKNTPDSFFSLTPKEFQTLTQEIRIAEKALGTIQYAVEENNSRRGLWAFQNISAGDIFSKENIKSLRPGGGISSSFFSTLEGRSARYDIKKGTPIEWDCLI